MVAMAHSPSRGPMGPVNVTLPDPSKGHPTRRSLDNVCPLASMEAFPVDARGAHATEPPSDLAREDHHGQQQGHQHKLAQQHLHRRSQITDQVLAVCHGHKASKPPSTDRGPWLIVEAVGTQGRHLLVHLGQAL